MSKPTFKQRFRYYFENTMSQGPKGVIKWLGIASLTVVIVLGAVIYSFGIKGSPNDSEGLGFIEGAWQILMSTLDQGAMAADYGWEFRAVRFIATLASLFLLSILIGTISSGIDSKIDDLKKGKSKVLESNHTLILGWSDKIFTIINEIIEANSNQKKARIVILADRNKEELDDEIRQNVPDTKTTKIITRSGSPRSTKDIAVVNPNLARSIIILSDDDQYADTNTIKSVLAITNNQKRKNGKYHIVGEIKNDENLEAANLVANDEAVYIQSADLISRMIAQTCRQSGLSIVYNNLMQFEGDEIYFTAEPNLIGFTYKEALHKYNASSVIGIVKKDTSVLINPLMDYIIQDGDQIIAISEDDDTVILSSSLPESYFLESIQSAPQQAAQCEKTLILGWNEKGFGIIQELENYVAKGSVTQIISDDIALEKKITSLNDELQQQISFQQGNINDRQTIIDLKPESYDHIIVLSSFELDIQQSDAKTLICLLHLRSISESLGMEFSIVSEMRDQQNKELGVVAKADDFIISDDLISLMISQVSENKFLKNVYDVLFEAEGSEIYLKPSNQYVISEAKINFHTILESAAQRGETAIGYRRSSEARDLDKNFGIYINPSKKEIFSLSDDDFVIVLAED